MLFKRRLHGIELHDHPRCPRVIRDGATDYLRFIIRTGNAYGPTVSVLAPVLRERNITAVVDLCSGGGGPWPDLRSLLVKAGAPSALRVTLTDLYPNMQAFAEIAAADVHVEGSADAIDIEHDAIRQPGLRTLFSSFHHFEPDTAQRVLRNVALNGDGILLAEATRRTIPTMLFMLLAPLFVWLATPRLRPFRWSRLFFTYVIPAIPFVVCYDGIVSCLRTYSQAELNALFAGLADLRYEWKVGSARAGGSLPVTYALGLPASAVNRKR